MAKYFKVKTNYLKIDKEIVQNESGTIKVSEVRLFEAVDYTDAQIQAINRINEEGLCGECDLEIQKLSYEHVLYRSSEGSFALRFVKDLQKDVNENSVETYWYDIKVTKSITDDKGVEKYLTEKYLVEGEDLEDSLEVMRSYLKDEDEDYWWFSSVQETPIQEVILLNK